MGGTIFVDHVSQYVAIVHQISLKVGETLKSKHKFEQIMREHGVKVKSHRVDNVPFGNKLFREDVEANNQTIDFSGVGAHHQNGVAECAIGTITRFAQTMMLQQAILWPNAASLKPWPFAMDHTIHVWNNPPKKDTCPSALEMLSQMKEQYHHSIVHSHVWGCPVCIPNPKPQDGKKLPKWDP